MFTTKEIPLKMKALVLHGIGDLRLDEVNVPEIQKDCVLLNIKNCGICSSDIERVFVNGTYHFPTIPGHEFSGEIVGVYDEKDKELLGKSASVFPLLPCNECSACKDKKYAQCSNYNYFGSRCDGAFSEYLVVPKWNLIYFDGMDYDVAALCEPAAVALHATKKADIVKNNNILVLGTGTIGLLIAMFAKVKGANVVIGARRNESMDYAKKLGFDVLNTNNLTEELSRFDGGFDYVFEAVGSNESISQSIMAAGNFAKIVVVGNPKGDLVIDKNIYWKVLRKEITITGTWNSSYSDVVNDWQEALSFMRDNYDIFKSLITNVYNLDAYDAAFDLLRDKKKFKIKTMFKNDR